MLRGSLCGHNDSVWGLVYSSVHHRLLSCSGDGTVRLWNAADIAPALAVFNEKGGMDTDKETGRHSQIYCMSVIITSFHCQLVK